jgi:integrase
MPKKPQGIRYFKTKDGSRGRPSAVFQRPHPTAPGKRLTETKTFDTEADALLWLSEQRVKHAQEPDAAPNRNKTTFAQLVERWKKARYPTLAPSTRARYEQVVANHLMPRFGATPVVKMTRMVVRDYLADVQSDGVKPDARSDGKPNPHGGTAYSPGTIHKIHTTLSSIMAEAIERGLIKDNPCHGLNGSGKLLTPERTKDMEVLSEAEVRKLAEAIATLPYPKQPYAPNRVVILVAAYSGLRASELFALRRRDVDLENGEIHVRRAIKAWPTGGEPVFGDPKTRKSTRDVPIMDEIHAVLTAHLSPGGHPDDLVFTNSEGNCIRRVPFYAKQFKPARDLALPHHPDVTLHDLRHCFCSWLLEAGVPLATVSEWAGHGNAAITAARYIHAMKKASGSARFSLSRGKDNNVVAVDFAKKAS